MMTKKKIRLHIVYFKCVYHLCPLEGDIAEVLVVSWDLFRLPNPQAIWVTFHVLFAFTFSMMGYISKEIVLKNNHF